MIDIKRTGENLKKKMHENGYTVIQLADKLNVHTHAVYKWYQGINMPTIDNLCNIADLYGTTIDELIIRR